MIQSDNFLCVCTVFDRKFTNFEFQTNYPDVIVVLNFNEMQKAKAKDGISLLVRVLPVHFYPLNRRSVMCCALSLSNVH